MYFGIITYGGFDQSNQGFVYDSHVYDSMPASRSSCLLTLLPAVIRELDSVVLVAVFLCVHDHLKEGLVALCPVHYHPSFEEPVTAVLAERMTQIQMLYDFTGESRNFAKNRGA